MKTILIDLWGTLIQFNEFGTLHLIIKELNLPLKQQELIQKCNEIGLFSKAIQPIQVWKAIMLELNRPEEDAHKANELWINANNEASLFPETKEFLEGLKAKGHRLVLASAIDKNSFAILDKRFSFSSYFDDLQPTYTVGFSKSQEYYAQICKNLNVEPTNCVMIGDTINFDIIPAAKVGMTPLFLSRFLLTSYEKESLPENTLICKDYDEVLALL